MQGCTPSYKPTLQTYCTLLSSADWVTSHLKMTSVHVLAFLLGLFVLCHSDCFFQELVTKDLKNVPKGCVDKDGHHDFGSEWVKDCMQCFCTEDGLSCCSLIPDDIADIPEGCELVVDEKSCSYKIVLKTNKAEECRLV